MAACCGSCAKGSDCASSGDLAELAPLFLSPSDAEESFLVGGVVFQLCPGVPRKVAWRLAVPAFARNASEAYELGECNAVRASVVVLNFIGGTSTVTVEGSLDKSNWQSIGTLSLTALGYRSVSAVGVTYRFVRLRHTGGTGVPDRNFILTTTLTGSRI